VAYYRVSTDKQGQSGLGLDAQRAAVELHARSVGAEVIAEFQDVESGRKADRVGLAAALAMCRTKRATLLIAKLDRLARSVAFISNLMEGGVDFVAADMPSVNRLTVHVLAAVAEHERERLKIFPFARLDGVQSADLASRIIASGCWRRSGDGIG